MSRETSGKETRIGDLNIIGTLAASTIGLERTRIISGRVEVDGLVTSNAGILDQAMHFGADGSVLDNLPVRTHPAESLLKQAVWWIDSAHSSAGNQSITNLGWGGSALDARAGSSSGADSNDPKYLDWDGENYIYLPGNGYLTVPDAANLDITGDIDIRVRIAMDDWTPASELAVLAKEYGVATRSYMLAIATTGAPRFYWSTDGTNWQSRLASAVPAFTDGLPSWLRVTLDVDNGASGHDVKFFTSTDGLSWTQLGVTQTVAGTTSIYSGSAELHIGTYPSGGWNLTGKVHRIQVLNGIDGSPVLDIDTSVVASGAATTFTARTGQTVTINRSTSGRKAVCVVHPVWLLGTDDYLEVPDNDLIDFGASDSFTVLAVVRQWATQPTSSLVSKKQDLGPTAGYALYHASSSNGFGISEGTALRSRGMSPTLGSVGVTAGVRDTVTDTIALYYNGVTSGSGVATTDLTTGSLASTYPLRVARTGDGSGYADIEFFAAAVFRRALTTSEINTITAYYSGRAGN